jgi:hypothetical protein
VRLATIRRSGAPAIGPERNRTGFCSRRTYAYGLFEGAADLRRVGFWLAAIVVVTPGM